MQLFADLHPIFASQYLHKVDNDSILICESYKVGKKTTVLLENIIELDTPEADAIINNLEVDQDSNVTVEVEMKGEMHKLTLNSKVTINFALDQVKDGLIKSKSEIISCMVENIRDQNGEDSLAAKMDVFNLQARDDLSNLYWTSWRTYTMFMGKTRMFKLKNGLIFLCLISYLEINVVLLFEITLAVKKNCKIKIRVVH